MRGKRRKGKPVQRRRPKPPDDQARREAKIRAAFARGAENQIRRERKTAANRKAVAKTALRSFKPKKSDRGKIVFIGVRGGRITGATRRKGFGLYISKSGKKKIIRQYDKTSHRVERTPVPRKLTTFDVSRVRSKSAKKQFLTTHLNPAVRAILRKKGKGISQRGTRYAGKFNTTQFYASSDSVTILAQALARAVNAQKSKRDFLVSIGVSVKESNGRLHFISLERRFSRADGQDAKVDDVRAYFGREVYAFLARELSNRGLVLSGSARHIGRLKANRGKPRSRWQKDGFLWQGHDENNVTIQSIEYRFDQLTLSS